jgi:hypothetical protein
MGTMMNDIESNAPGDGGENPMAKMEEYVGPEYHYGKYIKNPEEMGMSTRGTMLQLADNMIGITSYSDLLVSGTGKAKKVKGPLGGQFFINSGGKCKPAKFIKKDKKTGKPIYKELKAGDKAKRWVYINNKPKGIDPITGIKHGLKGLVPGIAENAAAMNPLAMMTAMSQPATPYCKKITRSTTNKGSQTKHVAFSDITEGFVTLYKALNHSEDINHTKTLNFKDKPFLNIYNTGFSLLMLYLLYEILKKD